MDNLFRLNMQRSGLVDTMWDLIVDLIGACIVSVMGYAYLKNDRETFIVPWMDRFLQSNKRLLRRKKSM
jgi:hypothetical protein